MAENLKFCNDRNSDLLCLIETQFQKMDIPCAAVISCPYSNQDPDSYKPKKHQSIKTDYKDYGIICFGIHKGSRWDALSEDYLLKLQQKSCRLPIVLKMKARTVLAQIRSH